MNSAASIIVGVGGVVICLACIGAACYAPAQADSAWLLAGKVAGLLMAWLGESPITRKQ